MIRKKPCWLARKVYLNFVKQPLRLKHPFRTLRVALETNLFGDFEIDTRSLFAQNKNDYDFLLSLGLIVKWKLSFPFNTMSARIKTLSVIVKEI